MASVDNHDDEKVTNPYLAMREAKIARNQKRLSDLGLLKPPPPPPPPTKQQPIPTRHQQSSAPVRRSSRLSSLEQEKHSDDREGELLPSAGKRARDTPDTDTVSVARKSRSNAPTNAPPPAPAPAADSVRSISLDVDYLILGHNKDHRDGLLGKMVECTGKDYVIHKSFAKAAYLEDRQRLTGADRKLSFNKYSGVQEWKNCIFLWVNLGLGNDDSPNDFLDSGMKITWFGGSRMHENSPMFHKLTARNDETNIVLWCRRYNPETKTLSPYVCLGRLKYLSHEIGSHPLKFVWDLEDYVALQYHDDSSRVETFKLIRGILGF